jgi:hypothetical protein
MTASGDARKARLRALASRGQVVSLLFLPLSARLQALPLPCPLARWWLEVQSEGIVRTGGSVTNVRSAAVQASVSTGGCVTHARSAAAQASASTGGGVTDARSAAVQASASTGGSAGSARSVAAQPSASTGGGITHARCVAAQASASTGSSRTGVTTAVPSNRSEILRGSTLLLSNTKPTKLHECSTCTPRRLQLSCGLERGSHVSAVSPRCLLGARRGTTR